MPIGSSKLDVAAHPDSRATPRKTGIGETRRGRPLAIFPPDATILLKKDIPPPPFFVLNEPGHGPGERYGPAARPGAV